MAIASAALVAASLSATARADTVQFLDGTFDNADWAASILAGSVPSAQFTAVKMPAGGNPGDWRSITQDWTGPGGMTVLHLRTGATYDPSTQGAIDSIDTSLDASVTESVGLGVGYGIVLIQNGNYYLEFNTALDHAWTSIAHTSLHAEDFFGLGNLHPDFSSGGAPIQFGFFSSNGVADGQHITTYSGIDNWSVTIHHSPVPCNAAPCFQGLGDLPGGTDASYAINISSDGTTVVGRASSGDGSEAFRWRVETGLLGLGDLPGGGFYGDAFGVSADGGIVVGRSLSQNSTAAQPFEAFRWTAGGGMLGLGDVAGGLFLSAAYNISSDGVTVVGFGTADSLRAAYHTDGSGWVNLGIDPVESAVNDVTPDGSVMVGVAGVQSPEVTAWRWSNSGGLQNLGDLLGGPILAYATSVSADGSTVVGTGTSSNGSEAFRWTAASGMVGLGDLPGGAFDSKVTNDGVSPDGTLIVGYGTTAIGQEAAIWDEALTIARLADVFADHGVVIPIGWTLNNTTGITINGGVVSVCGYGTNPQGNTEAWIARYALPPVCDAPQVTVPPQAAAITPGGAANFTVTATGTAPLAYQWRKDGVNLADGPTGCGGTITGATTAALSITGVSAADADDDYDVVVTNACGSATSTAATLTVQPPAAPGDVNADGQVNALDIGPFVQLLLQG